MEYEQIKQKYNQMDKEVVDYPLTDEQRESQLTNSKTECDRANHKSQSNNLLCRLFGHKWHHKYKELIFCERCKRLWRYF